MSSLWKIYKDRSEEVVKEAKGVRTCDLKDAFFKSLEFHLLEMVKAHKRVIFMNEDPAAGTDLEIQKYLDDKFPLDALWATWYQSRRAWRIELMEPVGSKVIIGE